MIVVLWDVIFAFVIAAYALLKYGNDSTFPQMVIFCNVVLATFVAIIVVYGSFAKVNGVSLKTLSFLREKVIPKVNARNNANK